jgi:3',5'-cyclic AMP phosphodiesterase CpdA
LKFIQISDTHLIEDWQPSIYGIDPTFRLEKAIESINKWHKDTSFITITGDLCNQASKEVYAKLHAITKNSILPIYPILGNHDNREIFAKFYPELMDDGFVQYVKKIDGKIFIFLDTLVKGKPYGKLCDTRFKWLSIQLQKYKNKPIYICMHHHPIKCGLYEMDNKANFKTSEFFWNLLRKYNNIKHISFGHIHRIMHSTKNGISLHSTRSTAFQVAYRPDSKEEFLTNEENPTYAIIDIDKNNDARVHHHEYLNEDRIYKGLC